MKIKFFNNSLRSTAELDILIEKAINWLKKQGLTNLEWSTISADEPTKKDLEILYALGKKWKILNDAFYKKQIDKYLEEDCEICVFCHSPNGDELINVAEPTNIYKMVCCQCIIDSDDAWYYIRHELIHCFSYLCLQQGLPVVDNQDQRQQEAQVYYTGDNELKQQIEIENLQDVKANWHKIQPNKSITLVKLMLQTVSLMGQLIIKLFQKDSKKPTKEWVIEKFVQAHAVFEGFGKLGNIATAYNNPGCLKWVGQKNSVKGGNGFALFNTVEDGWNALREQVKLNLSGKSSLYDINQDFYSYIYVYASTSPDNEKVAYAEYIAKQVGVSPDTKLKDLWA